ncbi:MAG TPA: GTP cyclohydrolase I FolE [Acidothermaceae bacterium]|nr:GTP cyclohydrolase I FolE [Acidothermaceae bacterium]
MSIDEADVALRAQGSSGVRARGITDHHSRPDLRVVPDGRIDLVTAERAAHDLLDALGLDLDDETVSGTPGRMVRALAELMTPREFTLTTFPNDEAYDELVIARRIPFTSLCEHHMLPFTGVAAVGYLPGARILGLSKLARVVELFARRPQVQERLTTQVARWLDTHLSPKGVGVVIEAEHSCMTLRGVEAHGSTTVTSALLGTLRTDPLSRSEFLTLAGQRSG